MPQPTDAHPLLSLPLPARRALLGALATGLTMVLGGCGDEATGPQRPRVAVADSVLVASLAGTWSYHDTIAAGWREAGRAARVMSVRSGVLTATVTSPLMAQLRRRGIDSVWFDTTATVSFVRADSFPGFVWLLGDTLNIVGAGASVPRGAVSDSGIHYTTTTLAHPDCEIWRMLWVPAAATELRCHLSVHWRPLASTRR